MCSTALWVPSGKGPPALHWPRSHAAYTTFVFISDSSSGGGGGGGAWGRRRDESCGVIFYAMQESEDKKLFFSNFIHFRYSKFVYLFACMQFSIHYLFT